MTTRIKTGLFGFGIVGQGFHQVVQQRNNDALVIDKICVRDPLKKRPQASAPFTFEKNELLQDADTAVFVELIDRSAEALDIARSVIKAGKSLVSANKKMIAESLDELLLLQKNSGSAILYEGSVGGSIPIIRLLETYYAEEPILQLQGILNGTTNYILSRMGAEGSSYEEALKGAQELGYAESDPTLDVSGFDARYKLSILLVHAFGARVPYHQILVRGIQQVGKTAVAFAASRGAVIKLVARAVRTDKGVSAFVFPAFASPQHRLHGVNEGQNAVLINTVHGEEHLFTGKGAGSLPTGLAVVSDVEALQRGFYYRYRKLNEEPLGWDEAGETLQVWIGFEAAYPESLKGYEVQEIVRVRACSYVKVKLNVQQLRQLTESLPGETFLAADLTGVPLPEPVGSNE